MKILAVCSVIDFVNWTRRATLENIWKQHSDIDFLLYYSVKFKSKPKKLIEGPLFFEYRFWIPETLKKNPIFSNTEYILRKWKWRQFFKTYDVIFFTDPNQYYLIPYLDQQKVIYLIRDPHCLFDPKNHKKEIHLIKRANVILCTAQYLASDYIQKYYNIAHPNVYYWPNTVDTSLWNFNRLKEKLISKDRPRVGLAGNLTNYTDDFELLDYLTAKNPEIDFEITGKIKESVAGKSQVQDILTRQNVYHHGFLTLPQLYETVMNWDVGLVIAKPDFEMSRYINNNKQYQYVALGKPFVTYNVHGDYSDFDDMVFVARDKEHFSSLLREAIQRSKKEDAVTKGLEIARRNSAEARARHFLAIVNEI